MQKTKISLLSFLSFGRYLHGGHIETTIPSYLAARASRDIVVAGHQQIIHDWCNIIKNAEFKQQADDFVRKGMEEFASRLPLGRAAMPDDVARVVLLAVSDLAKFMTGVIIPVDGGETAI